MSLLEKIRSEMDEIDEVDELVALLSISQLPTIVVEDNSDVRIYSRWIGQRLFGTYNVDVLAASGRENLLNLYERKREFAHLPVAFVANRGMWLFPEIPGNKIPKNYAAIILTEGYSIENDIYSKGEIENLIHSDENRKSQFGSVKRSIITWFASEVAKSQEGIIPNLDELVPKGQTELDKSFHIKLGFVQSDIIDGIRAGYRLKLPGKLLFQMVARFSEISLDGLYNTALVNYEAEPRELIEKIRRNLGVQRSVSSQEIQPESKKQNHVTFILPRRTSNKVLLNKKLTPIADSFVDDFVEVLKHTETPTVVVEGKDSAYIITGLIEQYKEQYEVSVQHISGKNRLLSVYDRRNEFAHKTPVAFVANQEMWLFSEIPESYLDIIWTEGYSLENDLYTDGNLENLIDPHERWKHQQVLNATIKWFAFEVEEFLGGKLLDKDKDVDKNEDVRLLDNIVLPGQLELNKKFCESYGFYEPQAERVQEIRKAYKRALPGKFLLQILERFLNTRGRSFNYNVNVQDLYDIVLMVPEVKVGDTIKAKILKKDGPKVTVQPTTEQPSYNLIQRIYQTLKLTSEEITFERRQYPGQVGDEHEVIVISVDRGKVKEVLPLQHEVKVGDIIKAKILKKDGIKVTVQLITANKEEITFEQPYYPVQVGNEHKMKVISVDRGRVKEVLPLQREVKIRDINKVGDKINAKILKKDGFQVTVQLKTDNNEEIVFEHPYFPGQVGEEIKMRVDSVDNNTKKVIKATFKGLK